MRTQAPQGYAESPTGPSPADAAQELHDFGSAVLRKAWRREDLSVIRSAIVDFCAHRQHMVEYGSVDPLMREYHEMGTTVLTWLIYEGRLDLEFLKEMFRGSFYESLCQEYFDDDRLFIAPERIGSRYLRPPYSVRSALPFHQDSVEQDRRIDRVLNCWIPLDDGAGMTSPGVEVVRHPGRRGFRSANRTDPRTGSRYDAVAIDRDSIVAEYGEVFLAPAFDMGDSFVFSQNVIHRTHVTPQMDRPRIGFEFRVFSTRHLAPGANAEALESTAFPMF